MSICCSSLPRRNCSSFPLGRMSAAIIFLTISSMIASAQTGTSSIRGQALDSQSRAVPGAHITLTDVNNRLTRTDLTGGGGEFTFVGLPPGTYRLDAEATGFKKLTIEKVIAPVDSSIEIPVHFEVGAITQAVTVSAAQDSLQSADAALGNAFDTKRIEDLPLNARNIVGLLSLEPGVTRSGEVNGARRDQANVTLDGTDNNYQLSGLDPVAGARGLGYVAFGSVLRSTPESVQEFRVVTTNPDATEGRSSGAQVVLITRSGTNQFHGSAYEFNRNTDFTANDWFNNQAGRYLPTDSQVLQGIAQAGAEKVPRPKLNRNVFGFTTGGPLIRNRLFFFFNYEGLREASETSETRTVPTATFRQGIFQYQNTGGGVTTVTPAQFASLFPGTGGENPVALQYLQAAPLPNYTGIGDGLNLEGYRFNAKTPGAYATDILKLDYRISDRQLLSIRGNYQNDNYFLPQQLPTSALPHLWVHPKGFTVGHDWSIGDHKVNTVRFGFTREALTQEGDADQNTVRFYTYRPTTEQRSNWLTSPVLNGTEDFAVSSGRHTLHFGGNVRAIGNNTTTLKNSYDLLSTNYAFYPSPTTTLLGPLGNVTSSFNTNAEAGVAILLGRLTQYTANILYSAAGQPLPPGSPAARSFATQEYEGYAQDSWRIRPNLTLVYGFRYSVDRPIYERNGFQTAPSINLSNYLALREAGAAAGQPYNTPLSIVLSGPANGGPGAWKTDWTNIAPNAALAWSPRFQSGLLRMLAGESGKSVIRTGFREMFDHFGSAAMAFYDQNSSLGFSTTSQTASGQFNLTNNLPPLLTTAVSTRNFPGVVQPAPLTFPLTYPSNQAIRNDAALDSNLQTPREYEWNFTLGRQLTKSLTLEMSYVGRLGRHLLVSRDVMQYNNLADPSSKQTWYQAAGLLAQLHNQGLQLGPNGFNKAIPGIPFFDDLFPGNSIQQAAQKLLGKSLPALNGMTPSQQMAAVVAGGANGLDITNWVQLQSMLNNFSSLGSAAFIQPQYSSLLTYSTVGTSSYNGLVIAIRERLSAGLTFDVNYTHSKSFDTGSTLEGGGGPNFAGLALNAFNVNGSRALSDFDIPNNWNANFVWSLPVGHGKRWAKNIPGVLDAFIGGWQLTGIWRYQTGLPINFQEVDGFNAVASQQVSNAVRTRPVSTTVADVNGYPSIFANPVYAYQSFVNAMPGQQGDRNVFRLPHYTTMDAGLAKTFRIPGLESHTLQLRWEVFNVTNSQAFGSLLFGGIGQDPFANQPQSTWGRFGGSQTPVDEGRPGRIMQFGLRYAF